MNKTGYDNCGEYKYCDIKDYEYCCTCRHFFDNELETRFECHKECCEGECYESKFEN